jgi:hypothetical protein
VSGRGLIRSATVITMDDDLGDLPGADMLIEEEQILFTQAWAAPGM